MRQTVAKESCSTYAELLFNALDNADMEEVNACLDRAPDCLNERDEEQRVPLHYAADCTDLATFQRCLDLNPALIDAQDNCGFTPLLVAVMSGNVDALELLMMRGAQLTHVDAKKHSAVHWAVVCAQVKSLECLLQHGAPSETADAYGARPLHYATVIEDVSVERAETILHLLLKEGVNVNVTDLDGRTPLIWAASNGNEEGFKSLVQAGANKFATDHDGLGVLHCAAYHGHASIIRLFIDQSGRTEQIVNVKDRNGDTPLFYACTYGHYECAKILLDNSADANHTDKRCRCAAHCAAAKGQLRIMKLLKHYGASFQLQNHHGDLPFHEAVQTGSISLVEWLLQLNGKFVSAANFYGRTPLHLAAAGGNMELTVLLCNRGAKINPLMLYWNDLYTPLDLAQRRGHSLIVEYLSQRHEAQTAAQLSIEKHNTQRNNILEHLKTAKLRRLRAQLSSSSDEGVFNDGNNGDDYRVARRRGLHNGAKLISDFSFDGRKYKIFRRHKSMLSGNTELADGGYDNHDDMPEFFISRNVKSAPGIRAKSLPKSTSTTELSMKESLTQQQERQEKQSNGDENKNDTSAFSINDDYGGDSNSSDSEDDGNVKTLVRAAGATRKESRDMEQLLVKSTIQKIVKEELRKAASDNTATAATAAVATAAIAAIASDVSAQNAKAERMINGVNNISLMSTQDSMDGLTSHSPSKKPNKQVKLIDVNTVTHDYVKRDETSRPRLVSPPITAHTYYYQEEQQRQKSEHNGERGDNRDYTDGGATADEDDEHALTITSHHYQTSRHRIQSAKKHGRGGKNKAEHQDEAPSQVTELHIFEDKWQPCAIDNDFTSIATVERRYVHEKAIFEELTHLKRMQIQYGRVQERVLVRSLIANFCKMHGLNPSHFRYQTFNEWEKFLYDQLKMIYLEERDRIQPSGLLAVGALPLGVKSSSLINGSMPMSHRSTARNAMAAASGGSHLSILSSLASSSQRFDNRLQKVSPLDERLRELTRIYSNTSMSERHRRQMASLTRRSNASARRDGALILSKSNAKRVVPDMTSHYYLSSGAVPRHHNSDAENGGSTSEVGSGRTGGGKRCECFTRHQPSQPQQQQLQQVKTTLKK